MLNKEVLESIFEKLLSQAKKSYDEFNAADGKIGDGKIFVYDVAQIIRIRTGQTGNEAL